MAKTKKTNKKQQETKAQKLSGIVKSCRKIMRKDKGLNGDADRLPMLTWIMFLKFLDDNEQMQEVNAELKGKKYKPAIAPPYRWRDWAKDVNLTGDDLLNFINNEKVTLADGEERTGLFYYLRSLQSESGTERRDVISTVFRGVTNRMINGYLLRDVVNKIDEIHFTNNEEINTLSHLYESILKEMRDASGDAGEFYTPRPVVKFMVEMLDPKIGESVLDPASGTGGFLVEAFDYLKKQAQTVEQREVLQKQSIYGGEAKSLPFLLCQMNLLLHGLEYPSIDSGNSLRFPLKDIGDSQRVDIILTNPPFGGEEERGILNNFPNDKQTAETALLFLQLIMRKLKRQKPGEKGGRAAVVVPDGILAGDGIASRIKRDLLENFNVHTIVRLQEGIFAPYTDIPCNLIFFEQGEPTKNVWYYDLPIPTDRKKYSKTRPISFSEFLPIKKWWNNRKEAENSWKITIEEIAKNDYNLDIKNPNNSLEDFSISIKDHIQKTKIIIQEVQIGTNDLFNDDKFNCLYDLSNIKLSEIKIGNVIKRIDRKETILPNEEYNLLGVSLAGRGPFLRETKMGIEIGATSLNKVLKNDFIYSRLFAWKGAFGVIPDDLSGGYVSNEFPIYSVDESIILTDYLNLYFNRPYVWGEVEKYCKGTTKASRNRFKEKYLLAMKIRIPSIEIQKDILRIRQKSIEQIENINILLSNVENTHLNILGNIYKGEL